MDELTQQQAVEKMFSKYDTGMKHWLTAEQLQRLHSELRIGGISRAQVEASIGYTCLGKTCEESELFDTLKEMDRRYYLLQDLSWEFSLLDTTRTDTISEEQAKWFVQIVHGDYFSQRRWERFLRQRAVPGSGVTFPEIEVTLCNIPSKEEWLDDQLEEERERQEILNKKNEMRKRLEGEVIRRRKQRELDKKRREEEERKQREEDERIMREEEERLRRQQQEKDNTERKRRKLEQEEAERKKKEEQEEEKKRIQEELEKERQKEIQHAEECEKILQETKDKEKEAADEAERQKKLHDEAADENARSTAEVAEKRARLKVKELRNKRIRYNLKVAVKRRDRDKLPHAVDAFKAARLSDDDMDLAKAEQILREFKASDALKGAITQRQLVLLENAMAFVRKHGFEKQLMAEMMEAETILLQLKRLERIRSEILELKQSTVAEIRSYQNPPVVVHTVMSGTFILLGHKHREMKQWKSVQSWVGKTGKDGLKRRCLGCNPNEIKVDVAMQAKALLGDFDLEEVRDVSAGAATFFVWSLTMIEEVEARIQQNKIKQEAKREKERLAKIAEEQRKSEEAAAEDGEPQPTDAEQGDQTPNQSNASGDVSAETTSKQVEAESAGEPKKEGKTEFSVEHRMADKVREANKEANRKVQRVKVIETIQVVKKPKE